MHNDNIWDALSSCAYNANRIGTREIEGQAIYTEREAVEFAFKRLKPFFIQYNLIEDELTLGDLIDGQ